MPNANARSTRYLVVFDGQSFNVLPAGPTGFPPQLMNYFPNISYVNPSKGATEWEILQARAYQEVFPHASRAEFSVLVMNGGTSDVGVDNSTTIYNEQKAYAQAARAAGFDKILNVTILKYNGINAGQDTNRLSANTLILGNADGAWDGVADFAGDSRMQNPLDTNYFSDGVHPAAPLGIGVEVELSLPFLKSWLT